MSNGQLGSLNSKKRVNTVPGTFGLGNNRHNHNNKKPNTNSTAVPVQSNYAGEGDEGYIKTESKHDDDDPALARLNGMGKNHGACKFCRARHLFCRGTPTCYNCQLRSIPCVFASPKKRGPKPKSTSGNSSNSSPSSTEASPTPHYVSSTSSSPLSSELYSAGVNDGESSTNYSSSTEFHLVELQDNATKYPTPSSPIQVESRSSPSPWEDFDLDFLSPFSDPFQSQPGKPMISIPSAQSLSVYTLPSNGFSAPPPNNEPEAEYQEYLSAMSKLMANELSGLNITVPSLDYLLPSATATIEGAVQQFVLLAMLSGGAALLHRTDQAKQLYMRTLEHVDIFRPWRTRYVKHRFKQTVTRRDFYQKQLTLEEEVKELKIDENICFGFNFATLAGFLTGDTSLMNELIASMFEGSEQLLKNWLRVSSTYNLPITSYTRKAIIFFVGFCWLWMPEEERCQYQDILTSCGPVEGSDLTMKLLLVSRNLVDEMLDIFCSIWSFYPSLQSPSPPPRTQSTSAIEYSYQKPMTMEVIVINELSNLESSRPSTYIDTSLIETNFIVTKERSARLSMIILQLEDTIAQMELDPTFNTEKTHAWRSVADALQSATLWVLGKKNASFQKFQKAATSLAVFNDDNFLFTQLAAIYLKLIARLHNYDLNTSFKCHPGIVLAFNQITEGVPSDVWLSAKSFSPPLQPSPLTKRELRLLCADKCPL